MAKAGYESLKKTEREWQYPEINEYFARHGVKVDELPKTPDLYQRICGVTAQLGELGWSDASLARDSHGNFSRRMEQLPQRCYFKRESME